VGRRIVKDLLECERVRVFVVPRMNTQRSFGRWALRLSQAIFSILTMSACSKTPTRFNLVLGALCPASTRQDHFVDARMPVWLPQIVVHHVAEAERKVGKDVDRGHNLKDG